MTVEQSLRTADDLLRLPDDGMRHELVRGELRTTPPAGFEHSCETSDFDLSLAPYVKAHRLRRVVTGEPGFRLATDPDTVRAPDVAFVLSERVPPRGKMRGYF